MRSPPLRTHTARPRLVYQVLLPDDRGAQHHGPEGAASAASAIPNRRPARHSASIHLDPFKPNLITGGEGVGFPKGCPALLRDGLFCVNV